RSDLAVLQIEVRKRLPEIEMGNSDDLMIGEMVIAIGNPFGLSHTVTTGVVSALDRSVRAKNRIYRHFIQTDASINPGNSGGPLLNIEGELIGVNSAIYQKAQGIGFAIPVNKAKRIVKELLKAGEVRFPWLGLEIQELSHELKTYFNLSEGSGGVLINNVIQKGPAHRAGLKRGDILLKFEGTPIFSLSDYHGALAEFTPSDPVRVTVFRKGKEMSFFIQPSIFPLDLVLELVYRRLGIKVDEMKENVLKKYGLREGVAIEEVRQGSEAKQAGLRPGDLILKINHITVNNLDEFKKAISRYHHLPSLTMLVQRGSYGYSLILPF
ncbi:MAG: PDZ domain-containing protein, partial [Thermodesulfobacteriota bacterium]|nr:PDZ domain-containing protein [Thermodesulfobacteriota bacterium]